MKKIKAVSLISGGLDSLLATKVIIDQGIYVEAINFFSGFFGDLPDGVPRYIKKEKNKHSEEIVFDARWIADTLGIKLNIIDAVEDYKHVLFNPKHGYGAHLNPCLDCKIFMVNETIKWMKAHDFDFIITGEVIGQRPKSQRKDTMPIVAQNTEDRLLRPLCAKLLPPTLPEREGWVNRELLYDFNGRNRKPQIELAKKFGFKNFPQPAGGCILTDSAFTNRMRDYWQHRDNKNYSLEDVILLKIGRHLRLTNNIKLIIGRDGAENYFLREHYSKKYSHLQSNDFNGALVIIDGQIDATNIEFIAKITAFFSQGKNADSVQVLFSPLNAEPVILNVKPLPASEIDKHWYI